MGQFTLPDDSEKFTFAGILPLLLVRLLCPGPNLKSSRKGIRRALRGFSAISPEKSEPKSRNPSMIAEYLCKSPSPSYVRYLLILLID